MPAMTRARFRLLAATAALLASTGLMAGSALPAAAAASASGSQHRVLTYVALGDSYAAGQATTCAHTASSYPLRLDALHRVKLLRDASCASATTSDVLSSQLGALNRGVKLVTITVGANDLDVAGLEATCVTVPASCLDALASRETVLLPSLPQKLLTLYAAIAARAPHATILVTAYPSLFAAGPIADAELALNGAIQSAVTAAAHQGIDIAYVPVDFSGHTADVPNPADSWYVLQGPDIFHPNARGDAAIARAIAAAL